jgi:hypothetical protein
MDKDMGSLLLLTEVETRDNAILAIQRERKELQSLFEKAKPLYQTKRSSGLLARATKSLAEYGAIIDTLISLSKHDKKDQAYSLYFGKMRGRVDKTDRILGNLDKIKLQNDINKIKTINYGLSVSIIFTVVTLIITIIFKVFVFRSKRKPRKPDIVRRADSV